ncbi:hypothetical protein AB1K62_00190 [Parasphingorhabdus sp. JC815]|uniref:hypothetical protein n=1 Tax=Parasphingorhabdus sp. JC815 TaxID=3232140 RepID=UPI00345AFEC7
MTNLLKPALIVTPAIMALAACDAPPAEDPALDADNSAEIISPPIEEPLDAAPIDETAPIDDKLTGGEAPLDEMPIDKAMPDTAEADAPAGEDSKTDENSEAVTTE